MMLYFEHVESTLKKGCKVQLGPRTVICGPNGSGKSTIVQSLELASNGWASDMEGRSRVKQHTALARLFPPAGAKSVEAILSDGTVFSWSMEKGAKPGSFKKPDHHPPFLVSWPVQDLMDTLRGDAGTVGSWLEKEVVGSITAEELLAALPPAVRPLVSEYVKKKRKTDFIALSKDAKQEAKNLRAQATRSEATIERMTEGVAPPMLDSTREKLETRLETLALSGDNWKAGGVTREEHEAVRLEIDGLVNEYTAKSDELAGLSPLPAEVSNALDQLVTAGDLIRQHVSVFGKDECWVCGNEDPKALDAQAIRLTEAMSSLNPQHQESVKQQILSKEVLDLDNLLQQKAKAFKKLKVVEPVDDSEYRSILQSLSTDDAANRTWKNADAARKECDQFRSRAALLTLAGNALEKAGKQFLSQRKQTFEDKVSGFLPEGERLGVDLKSSRMGLVRGGEIHSALSGAEWSRILLALASAQGASSTPCVLVPEDRAWDRDTLGRVMHALSDAPVQVIIMSTVSPDPVEGWTCINL